MSESRVLLSLESSCDETAAAVICADRTVLSSVIASQQELHADFGGVVPEIASRAHLRRILPVIDQALRDANVSLDDLCAVAVTTQPGLVGSLLVGLTAAKTLAMVLDIPLVPINHIESHIYACRMHAGEDIFPAIGLVVSGGHSNLYDCASATDLSLLGSTVDDAAGEAFDKVARILDLPYPGGPSIEKLAKNGNRKGIQLPRPFLHDKRLDFSFSGLKTAVLYSAKGQPGKTKYVEPLTEQRMADMAASFQEAVVDCLIAKCELALKTCSRDVLCVGGGVAANGRLRERLAQLANRTNTRVIIAPMDLCTDNAAMGAIAWELFERGVTAELDVDVVPGLVRKKAARK